MEPADRSGKAHREFSSASSTEMNRAARVAYRVLRAILYGATKLWFRVSVSGVEHVPSSGGYILAPGAHRSILDTPIASLAGHRVLRYMGAENYFEIPVFGSFLRAMGGFAVERSMTDRAALRAAEAVLARGEPLVIFPEGTRQNGPLIGEMKEGASFLACRSHVPIVPVGIGGADRALPKGKRIPRPRKITVVIGEPLQPPNSAGVDGNSRVKRSSVRTLTEELRVSLQVLYDEAQRQAGIER